MISDDDLSKQSQDLIQRLREQGHHGPARRLAASVEDGALMVLRETLETVLTAIEAVDTVTETMKERLGSAWRASRLPREGGKTG